MATIYRFIVETKSGGGGRGGRKEGSKNKKQTSKVGRYVSIFGGEKGGVEHNRKMRAVNPLLNKMTGGYWEKGMRLGRAATGLITKNTETGKLGISGPAIAIIIAMIIKAILDVQKRDRVIANQFNARDYKMLENGTSAIHGAYEIDVNVWNGRRTYKENK